ncbi:MAG: fructose-6-phosphate aldolase [Methylacidiphilales bacterium]|nr:fructose-6-phosphate aldolase [Candidatus Methylacidiphilales bacterium]MDW8349856.1 fructose-6-phosphate aldolase [Verrucomicrobiae bacterium]
MKIFIDSADLGQIREAVAMGIIDGVTTNPSLVAQSGKPFRQLIEEIAALVDGPISAEIVSLTAPEMIKEGEAIASWHKNIVIKVPLIPEGLKAVRHFTDKGIPTNVTLCFSANQALLAAKAGATYISPFVGRLDDIGHDGMELINDIRTIYDNYGFTTEILTASVRSPLHFYRAAKIGSDVITAPWSVLQQIFKHPLTDIGLKKFLDDWTKAQK